MSKLLNVALATLSLDADRQVRERLDEQALRDYTDLYTAAGAGALDPPQGYLDAAGDVWLWDGYTRATAAKLAGLTDLPVLVEEGSRQDALVRALCEANRKHGARLQPRDLRRKAELALRVPELAGLSNVMLAERIGVNRETIRQVRHELEAKGEAATVAVSTRDGKTRSTSNRSSAPAAAPQPPPMPDPSPALVELLRGLPDDLEIDVDTATELPLEQRAQRVSVWRFTVGYRVMSAASLAQLEALARQADQEMRSRAETPPQVRPSSATSRARELLDILAPRLAEVRSITGQDSLRDRRGVEWWIESLDGHTLDAMARHGLEAVRGLEDALHEEESRLAGSARYTRDQLVERARDPEAAGRADARLGRPADPWPWRTKSVVARYLAGHASVVAEQQGAAEVTPQAPPVAGAQARAVHLGDGVTVNVGPGGELLPPASERRAESRERGERIGWCIARLKLLEKEGCPEVAFASPRDHREAAPRLDDDTLADLETVLRSGVVLVRGEIVGVWHHLDLATMRRVEGPDGTLLRWSSRMAAEEALQGPVEAPAPVDEVADEPTYADAEQRVAAYIALTQAINHGVDEVEGLGDLLILRKRLAIGWMEATVADCERTVSLLRAHEEATSGGAWWLTTSDTERLRMEIVSYSDELAGFFAQPAHRLDQEEWATAAAAVDTWMNTDCDELPVMEPRTFLHAVMHRAMIAPEQAPARASAPDPARDAIPHQDVRPVPGRPGELWLPIDASAEVIAEAIADLQSRCRKHLADPPRLAARVRADLDRVLHTAALWGLPVATLRPMGQWAELPPEDKHGTRPDTTVVEVCGQSYSVRPPEGVPGPALLVFRGGIRASGLEGVVEFRAPRAADPVPT